MTGLDQTREGVIGGGSRADRCEAKNDCENGTLHAVHIAILVADSGGRERGSDEICHRLADCQARDHPRGIEVLLQEGG